MAVRAEYDKDLEALRIDVDALGGLAAAAASGAMAALLGDSPVTAAAAVVEGDDHVDALFVSLEQRAYSMIALQAPVAGDLRFLMSALRVMSDFEKTGDRAIAIAKTAAEEWEREHAAVVLLGRMGDLALGLLADAREAWREQDGGMAAGLKRRDGILDACFRELTAHLLRQDGPGATSLVLHAYNAGRNIERIADHAVMIGERVSYLLTGDPSALAAEIR